MKYKIEIWQYHYVIDTFESNDPYEIMNWYQENYEYLYDNGRCMFYIYVDGDCLKMRESIDFEEKYKREV